MRRQPSHRQSGRGALARIVVGAVAAGLCGCARPGAPAGPKPVVQSANGSVGVVGLSLSLSADELRMRSWVSQHHADQIAFLERVVDINSGTMNPAGVRAAGRAFGDELRALGFDVRWIEMPPSMQRAGHLFAERRGRGRGKRLLLIGHLDTVFEGEGQRFVRVDSNLAKGAGSGDMKGGDVIILYALKALQSIGALDGTSIIVAFTGDEESAGDPLTVSRRDLVDAAKRSDVALAFEGGSRDNATVARRGASSWLLHVQGRQGHSGGIFSPAAGDGAIFEAARILDAFRVQLGHEQHLTFNPGVIVGGTDVAYDTMHVTGTATSKLNIIPRAVTVSGDLRFISDEQKERTRARMREIIGAPHNLPGTSATITFSDEYPAMAPTAANYSLLAVYDSVSRALGYGAVVALDPGRRGAGDISFVAPYVAGLDGLGAAGSGSHTPDERVDLRSLEMQTSRAALVIYRLTR